MHRKKAIQSHYESRISPGRENYDVLDWADPTAQRARFRILADSVDLTGKTLLDLGCGLGDLRAYLSGRKIRVDYTGVDIAAKIVSLARRQQPDARFECADIIGQDLFAGRRFDVVFCSGVFNLDLGNNLEFLPQALGRMFELSRDLVAFNLLHCRAEEKWPGYFYYDPAEVLEMLRQFPCQARLIDDYLPNDFTVICKLTRPAEGRSAKGNHE